MVMMGGIGFVIKVQAEGGTITMIEVETGKGQEKRQVIDNQNPLWIHQLPEHKDARAR
jgi:hypothetical protein